MPDSIKKKTTITITVDEKELNGILTSVEDVCDEAVSYVGAANYEEREREAHSNVESAFDRLREYFGLKRGEI